MYVRDYNWIFCAAMAQQAERRLGKAEATGSNPVSSLLLCWYWNFQRIYFLEVFGLDIMFLYILRQKKEPLEKRFLKEKV